MIKKFNNGKTYQTVEEFDDCEGCAFKNYPILCEESDKYIDCYEEMLIWEEIDNA